MINLKFIKFIIPKRINRTVWFAPFAIAIGVYGFCEGYTDIGIGSILGGVLLIIFYLVNRRINTLGISDREESLSD